MSSNQQPIHSSTKTFNGHPMVSDCGDGWTDEESTLCLPLVNISLKKLAPRMHALLDSHSGCLPLSSLLSCYFYKFNETFNTNDGPLVPLEHLITCLPGIDLTTDRKVSFKHVTWSSSKSPVNSSPSSSFTPVTSSVSVDSNQLQYSDVSSFSQQLNNNNNCNKTSLSSSSSANDTMVRQMAQFSREVRDLLKSQPRCLIPFSKFVPAYHNHFGRQCCVYQYGYTKLIELLEAIPHVVQILGEGSKKMLTLTHRQQTKRFASDLIRVLKAQPAKRLTLGEFPAKYEKIMEKPFSIENYGVCEVIDILVDVWEGTVLITRPKDSNDTDSILLEIPRRERTEEEMERTKYLIHDIIELFQSTPTLSMPFSKFIPAYHHYFKRQCRVADYGFTKLIELFESISPEIVELKDNIAGDEKIIKLSPEYRRKTIEGRLVFLIKSVSKFVTPDCLHNLYKHEYGHSIHFRTHGVENMVQLIKSLDDTLELVGSDDDDGRSYVSLVDRRWNPSSSRRSNSCRKTSQMPPAPSSTVADCGEIIDILSESVPSHLPMPTILPTAQSPDLISFNSPTSTEPMGTTSCVTSSDGLQTSETNIYHRTTTSSPITQLSTGDCPQPPMDWLKSFSIQSDSKNKSDSSRKVKPRRIAANFTANNPAAVFS